MKDKKKIGSDMIFLISLFLCSVLILSPAFGKDTHSKSHEKSSSESKHSDEKSSEKTKEVKKEAKEAKSTHSIHGEGGLNAEDALKKLLEGNKRYVSGKFADKNKLSARREEVSKGQHPFAIILSCSDSRVPPEVIFDQGLGDIFIVRTAGHVADNVAIGSIEYAVEHLGVKLIVVLGHSKCGAVDATVKGGIPPGHLPSLVDAIKPAVEKAKSKGSENLLAESIRANTKMVAQNLGTSKPILSELVEDGTLKIVGANYDLETGKVTVTYSPCMMQ